jgi:hypothetical protein
VFTWGLCTVVIVTALTWGVSTIRSGFSAALPTRTAGNGESMVVDLDPADAPAIYVGFDSPGYAFEISYPYSSRVDAECVLRGDTQDMALVHPERNVILTTGGVEWHQLFLVHLPESGAYELQCTGDGARFGVGKDLPGGLFNIVMGLLAGILAVTAIAVLATVVLLQKRRAARGQFPPPGMS